MQYGGGTVNLEFLISQRIYEVCTYLDTDAQAIKMLNGYNEE